MRRSFFAITGLAVLLAGVAVAQTGGSGASQNLDDIIAKVLADPPPPKPPTAPAGGTPVKVASGPTAQSPMVMSARIGEHEQMTRFVVEVSEPVKMRSFTLSGPNRVVIDMPAVQWRIGAPPRPSGTSAIRSYRYGLFRPGNSRFVLDLNQPVTISEGLVLPPSDGYGYRIVFDLYPVKQANFDKKSGWPADLRAREEAAEKAAVVASVPSTPQARRGKKVIVIDSGHGGIDSGTLAVNGMMEKDVVLDTATRLGKVLTRRGFLVHLTRDTDIFIPLRGRVNIARSHKADLFISLHADSNPDSNVSGASVYTLSDASSDKEAEKLAKKENQSDIIAGVDLGGQNSPVAGILFDLAQRDTLNRSSRFAETVVQELGKATDILPRKPHRSAGFAVLKAPDVPAVLIELGYLSNARNAAQMNTARWRDGVADAIADAVERQFAPGASLTAQGANESEPR